jgi:hypothetical protein
LKQNLKVYYGQYLYDMELDKEKLKEAFQKIPRSRHRQNVDQRSYIIGALYYSCGMTEQAIADYLEIKRDTVNYNKLNSVRFRGDRSYAMNTSELRSKFDYELGGVVIKSRDKICRKTNLHMIFGKNKNNYVLNLPEELCRNMEKYSRVCGTRDANSTIRRILNEFFETWEE